MLIIEKKSKDEATINVVNIMINMLDIVQTKRKELEGAGNNLFKSTLADQTNILLTIANTAANSTANDMFIDTLVALFREIYDEFPNADDLKEYILDCMELYWIAIGKHFQAKEQLFDKAILKAFGEISLRRQPRYLYFDPREKERLEVYKD